MSKFKIIVEYLGENYSGWQIQEGKKTIQGEITSAIKSVTGEDVVVSGSGRTDAGVSANAQVASFSISKDITAERLLKALNAKLPNDIAVKSAQIVPADFDARFSAKTKTYNYYFYINQIRSPLKDRFALQVPYADVRLMNDACRYLVGTFDFKSFVARNSGKNNFVRTIYSASVEHIYGDLYVFKICGNGFLYNMVRIIVGTLVSVGQGKLKPTDMATIIAARDRTKAGKTVPAVGLMLSSVEYNEN